MFANNHVLVDSATGHRDWATWQERAVNYAPHNSYMVVIRKRINSSSNGSGDDSGGSGNSGGSGGSLPPPVHMMLKLTSAEVTVASEPGTNSKL